MNQNLTSVKTASGLSLLVYASKYYKPLFKIPILKGFLEAEIRKAYFGGLVYRVDTPLDAIVKGFYYDINSMYPYCMLKDMPVGYLVIYIYK